MKLSLRGMALTCAILWGGAALLGGIANMIWPSYAVAFMDLLDSIYPGYHHTGTIGSVIVVTLYAVLDGLLGGLLFALLYNCLGCTCAPKAGNPT